MAQRKANRVRRYSNAEAKYPYAVLLRADEEFCRQLFASPIFGGLLDLLPILPMCKCAATLEARPALYR